MSLISEERKIYLSFLQFQWLRERAPARLMILTFLYVVEEGDMVYLLNQTGLTWGNLSANVHKLKDAGYVKVNKEFVDDRPQTWVRLTEKGRQAFRDYRGQMKDVLDDLPD